MARRDFLEVPRATSPYRPVTERVRDHGELIHSLPLAAVEAQAARCMDCGVPFCHHACPINNLIPEWNELARRGDWHGGNRQPRQHQQLSRVHRPALSGSLRARLRAGDQQ